MKPINPIDDLYRYEGNACHKLKTKFRYFFFTAGYRYTYLFRKTNNASNILSRVFWKFLLRQCMLRTGIQIPDGTLIGPGLKIGHFGTIVINPEAKIGRNFNIAHGTLIGNSQGKKAGVPIIGDNVCLQANSIVVGGVTIGDNVLIAPGAFVNFDVPSNSIVIGNPGKIIPKPNPTAKYMVYPLPEEQ